MQQLVRRRIRLALAVTPKVVDVHRATIIADLQVAICRTRFSGARILSNPPGAEPAYCRGNTDKSRSMRLGAFNDLELRRQQTRVVVRLSKQLPAMILGKGPRMIEGEFTMRIRAPFDPAFATPRPLIA